MDAGRISLATIVGWLGRLELGLMALGVGIFVTYLAAPDVFNAQDALEDPMASTAFATVIIVIIGARIQQPLFMKRVTMLEAHGQLIFHRGRDGFDAEFFRVRVWTTLVCWLVFCTLVYISLMVSDLEQTRNPWTLGLASALAAGLFASRFGWAIATGLICRHFRPDDVEIALVPGAADNASGLRPLGLFYFRQSMLVLIPVAYMSAWIVADWRGWLADTGYEGAWTVHYAILCMFFVLVVFNLAVILPVSLMSLQMHRFQSVYIEPVLARQRAEIDQAIRALMATARSPAKPDDDPIKRLAHLKAQQKALDDEPSPRLWPLPLLETSSAVTANLGAALALLTTALQPLGLPTPAL